MLPWPLFAHAGARPKASNGAEEEGAVESSALSCLQYSLSLDVSACAMSVASRSVKELDGDRRIAGCMPMLQ